MEARRIGLLSKAEKMLEHAKMMIQRAEKMNQEDDDDEMMLDDDKMMLDDDVAAEDISYSEEISQTENKDVAPVEDILTENKTMLTQTEEKLKGKTSDVP